MFIIIMYVSNVGIRRKISTENREYKSSVFSMLLSDKDRALDVYNALNNTTYDNNNDLEMLILENAIYLSYRNDASFILAATLNVYEHQSTYNPNMPLRDLIYVANLLSDIVKDEDLYGTKLIKIPTPQFVTFYNGVQEQPECIELKLSDAYKVVTEAPQLELKCTIMNLNKGNNLTFMSKCKTLREYMIFVDKVRCFQENMLLEDALDKAIDQCISEHILEDFLQSQKAQVKSMSVLEFNFEKQLMFAERTGREEGREEGSELKIISLVCKKLIKEKSIEIIADELEEDIEYVKRIYDVAKCYAPEYDVVKIYETLKSQVA